MWYLKDRNAYPLFPDKPQSFLALVEGNASGQDSDLSALPFYGRSVPPEKLPIEYSVACGCANA